MIYPARDENKAKGKRDTAMRMHLIRLAAIEPLSPAAAGGPGGPGDRLKETKK